MANSVTAWLGADDWNDHQATRADDSAPAARSHYTIGDVAREFGFTLRALRFYEEKKLISPRRAGNRRLYSASDRRRLGIIASGKKIGLSLEDIRDILKAENGSGSVRPMLRVALDKAVTRLEVLEEEEIRLKDFTRETVAMIETLKEQLEADGKANG